jgi:hypothetical protein
LPALDNGVADALRPYHLPVVLQVNPYRLSPDVGLEFGGMSTPPADEGGGVPPPPPGGKLRLSVSVLVDDAEAW